MKKIVVDASVAIKWFVPEIHTLEANFLLDMDLQLLAPDLIFLEVGNILWKKYRLKQLTLDTANDILHAFKRLPFNSYETESLLDAAWQIATKYHCTVYDSLYVALAQSEKCLLVTADRTLCNKLHNTSLNKIFLQIEDIKK